MSQLARLAQMAASAVSNRNRLKRADDPADTPADDDADEGDDDEDEDEKKQRKAKPKKADEDAAAAHRSVGPEAAAILRAGAARRVPLGDGDKFIINPAPQQTKGAVRDPVALAKLIVNSAKKRRGETA
jgi:hypothetical protein